MRDARSAFTEVDEKRITDNESLRKGCIRRKAKVSSCIDRRKAIMAITSVSPLPGTAAPAKPAAPQPAAKASSVASTDLSSEDLRTENTSHDTAPPPAQPTREQVNQVMEEMRQALPAVARNLQFSIDEGTGKTVVKVVDSATKQVIRQIPSEELLSIAKSLDGKSGLLVKQTV